MQFGLGGGKQQKKKAWEDFDLEKDLKDAKKLRAMKEKVAGQIQKLKAALRQGEDKKAFDDTQALLHGYLAVQKVIQRVGR